ncbi:hypothetical protein HJ588_15695 [Flexivirga sp. ID2601S]|uniref:Uncharacterized protein n=1 Tax=Flexivirga aerilata TaxID=1656889 RepID=A0A849AN34_9MICO|nr:MULTISPECIES: hypothetical protein [Flexivirga]NNG40708.1 hypothetical protein [Flexivirga aerilata]
MQNQKQCTAEAHLCTLLDDGDENRSHPEPATDQTTVTGYVVDLIFPTEDGPNS